MLLVSLIGNPVKIGDGPAAVIPPFLSGKDPFDLCVSLSGYSRMGRQSKGWVSQKTCLDREPSRIEVCCDPEDKKGTSPD